MAGSGSLVVEGSLEEEEEDSCRAQLSCSSLKTIGDTLFFDPLTHSNAENPSHFPCSHLPSCQMEFSRKISRSL